MNNYCHTLNYNVRILNEISDYFKNILSTNIFKINLDIINIPQKINEFKRMDSISLNNNLLLTFKIQYYNSKSNKIIDLVNIFKQYYIAGNSDDVSLNVILFETIDLPLTMYTEYYMYHLTDNVEDEDLSEYLHMFNNALKKINYINSILSESSNNKEDIYNNQSIQKHLKG